MKPAKIRLFFEALRKADPHPKTELVYTNPYTLLVAIVLSAQATDKGVNKATTSLFKVASTPQAMLALGEDRLKQHIKTIGLFNAKAKNIIGLSQALVDKFGAQVPETREELQSLPGVGRKTANVWLNCVLGEPLIAVDTHVFRVANRTGLAKAANPLACELQLEKAIPKPYLRHAHHWLILLGRYTCKARKPECPSCPVNKWCEFKDKTL